MTPVFDCLQYRQLLVVQSKLIVVALATWLSHMA